MSDETANHATFLREVKGRLARLFHDMNNPLAVASGNLEFVSELVRVGETEGVSEALSDIRAAHTQLEERLGDVLALRAALDAHLGEPHGSTEAHGTG